MDDDVDVNDVDFDDRNLLRRIGILRGWLIIYISGFRIPSRIVRLLLNRAAGMRSFSRYPILQSLCATSCRCISGFQKYSLLVVSVRPGCCMNAAHFLISFLSGAGRYLSIIF